MTNQVVQDWSKPTTLGSDGNDIEYRVVKIGAVYKQQLRKTDGEAMGSFDLPEGVRMDKQSYEVLLKFALSQVAA